jgi:hypothetical protein
MRKTRADEKARANGYYEQRDDDTRWGEPVEVQAPEQLTVMVSARFSREEADRISAAAAAAGMTRSAFIRQSALASVRGRPVDIEKIRRELNQILRGITTVAEELPN